MDFCDEATAIKIKVEPYDDILIPIVYTTKLDDMKIFKENITDLSASTVIETIIKESKPNINLKRKRNSLDLNDLLAYEDLSCHINAFNKKVARETEIKNNLLSLCKPVKIVLEDLKHTLYSELKVPRCKENKNDAAIQNKPTAPQCNENKKLSVIQNVPIERPKDWVISVPSNWKPTLNARFIYDKQRYLVDIYSLDKQTNITEYCRLPINKYKESNICRYHKRITKVFPCCWVMRDWSIETLKQHPQETIRFMRIPHKCAKDLCICCCKKPISLPLVTAIKPQNPSEAPTIWFNKITEKHASIRRLIPKSLSVVPKVSEIETPNSVNKKLPFLHSININIIKVFYVIGTNGMIKLSRNMSSTPKGVSNYLALFGSASRTILREICCWYNLEHFIAYLSKLGALTDTINFIKCAHPCSINDCRCCCKPKNYEKQKTILFVLPTTTRYTNDLFDKKANIKLQFPKIMACPKSMIADKPTSDDIILLDDPEITDKVLENMSNIPIPTKPDIKKKSFYLSLSIMDILSKTYGEAHINNIINLLIPENPLNLDEDHDVVRFDIYTSGSNYRILVEGLDLDTITTKQLKMLNVIFCILEKSFPKYYRKKRLNIRNCKRVTAPKRPTKPRKKTIIPVSDKTHSLSLNAMICLTSDLRSKRFLPSLRQHIDKYNLPDMGDIDQWINDSKLGTVNPNITAPDKIISPNKLSNSDCKSSDGNHMVRQGTITNDTQNETMMVTPLQTILSQVIEKKFNAI